MLRWFRGRPIDPVIRPVWRLPRGTRLDRLAYNTEQREHHEQTMGLSRPTSPRGTSSRPLSRTGRANSFRWLASSCSPFWLVQKVPFRVEATRRRARSTRSFASQKGAEPWLLAGRRG